jgi:AraC-like DNA-binding protein
MFEDKGGVRNYITERRALRAILDIANAPHRRGQISMAAADWGFSTMPNFNRAIKRLYGAPPSALFRTDASTGHELDDDRESFSRFLAEVSER